jgi:uncharacterized delta-60 repeat protein
MPRPRQRLSSPSSSHAKFFEPLERREMFSAGALDTSFSVDGKATLDFFPPIGINVDAHDVAVQGDGKTVVVGTTSDGRFALARANFDGTPDTTFGAQHLGSVITQIAGPTKDDAAAVTIQGDGKIVVVGHTVEALPRMIIARYLPSGALDPSFNGNGIEVTRAGARSVEATAVSIDANNRIVVAGTSTEFDSQTNMFAARFNTNGSLDTTFGGDGIGTNIIQFPESAECRAMAIDRNGGSASANPFFGTIVLVGREVGSTQSAMTIGRLTPDGWFDTRLEGNGRRTFTAGSSVDINEANGVVIQSGGRIVVAGDVGGFSSAGKATFMALVRFRSNGTIDSSFGGGTSPVLNKFGFDNQANDIIQSDDGSLIVGGYTGQTNFNGVHTSQFAVAKYSADGVLDTTFGTNGVTLTDFTSSGVTDASVARLAAGPGLRFVAAGGTAFATARYLDTGAAEVFATGIATTASEAHSQPVTFIVYREERLPVPTRVYFSIGGTATSPSIISARFKTTDYSLSGMNVNVMTGTSGYVDIPANETIALVTLTPIDDARIEGTETATFTIQNNASYEVGNPFNVTVTIKDNDFPSRQIVGVTSPISTTSAVASPMVAASASTTAPAAVAADLLLEATKQRPMGLV